MHAENGVFVEAELEKKPAAVAILRNVRHAALAPGPRVEPGEGRPSRVMSPDTRAGSMRPGNRFDQFPLAVAFDSGDADDLSGADIERHIDRSALVTVRDSER